MNSAKTMVNVSPKMSNRDAIERELEKFVKMFSTKAVQAIVQSRLGDKMQTFSNPRSLSNDWVSLNCITFFWKIFFIEKQRLKRERERKTNPQTFVLFLLIGLFFYAGIMGVIYVVSVYIWKNKWRIYTQRLNNYFDYKKNYVADVIWYEHISKPKLII